MRFGVTIFLTDQTVDPATVARAAEERGFDSLFVPEHTHIPTSRRTPAPMGEPLPEYYKRTLDPFVALATAAAVTTRLRVGTGICLVAQRDPIITAKEVATLDHLSGGRFTFGVGFGWNEDELNDHGVARTERREVTRERVLAMRALWTEEVAGYDGEHVSVSPSWAWPKPVQQPHPPIYIGGGAGPKLFAHVAEYGDAWMPVGGGGLGEAIPRLREAVENAGRDPDSVRVVPFATIPNEGKLERYASQGVDEVIVQLPSGGEREVTEALDAYAALVRPFRDG